MYGGATLRLRLAPPAYNTMTMMTCDRDNGASPSLAYSSPQFLFGLFTLRARSVGVYHLHM